MDTGSSPRNRATRPAPAALIYQGELDYLSRCILDRPSIETGGELFGYWTASGVPVVLYAIGPGPRANHEPAFFNQDVDYLLAVGNRLVSRFGLQHVGEWHSHHGLGLAHPSGHDAETIARSVASQGLGRFLLAIGTCSDGLSDIRPYSFHEDFGTDYTPAHWDVKEGESPFRAVVDADEALSGILVHPATARPNAAPVEPPARQAPFARGHWLGSHGGHAALKAMVDFLVAGEEGRNVGMSLDGDGAIEVVIGRKTGDERIVFPAGFPAEPPEIAFPAEAAPPPGPAGEAGAPEPETTGPEPSPTPEGEGEGEGTSGDAPGAAPEWRNTGDVFRDFTEYYNQAYLLAVHKGE